MKTYKVIRLRQELCVLRLVGGAVNKLTFAGYVTFGYFFPLIKHYYLLSLWTWPKCNDYGKWRFTVGGFLRTNAGQKAFNSPFYGFIVKLNGVLAKIRGFNIGWSVLNMYALFSLWALRFCEIKLYKKIIIPIDLLPLYASQKYTRNVRTL